MDVDQILKLVDAGFSKDEILQLTQDGSQASAPAPAPAPDPAAESGQNESENADSSGVSETGKSSNPVNEPNVMDALASLTKQVEALTKAQQSANRNMTNTKIVTQNTDEILAGLINPKKS